MLTIRRAHYNDMILAERINAMLDIRTTVFDILQPDTFYLKFYNPPHSEWWVPQLPMDPEYGVTLSDYRYISVTDRRQYPTLGKALWIPHFMDIGADMRENVGKSEYDYWCRSKNRQGMTPADILDENGIDLAHVVMDMMDTPS